MESVHTTTAGDVPVRRLDARIRNIGGTLVVAGPEQALELSDTARFLWLAMDGSHSMKDLADSLVAEHGVDDESAVDDVVELVTLLQEVRVVTVRKAGPGG
jgi:hypothetical protein